MFWAKLTQKTYPVCHNTPAMPLEFAWIRAEVTDAASKRALEDLFAIALREYDAAQARRYGNVGQLLPRGRHVDPIFAPPQAEEAINTPFCP